MYQYICIYIYMYICIYLPLYYWLNASTPVRDDAEADRSGRREAAAAADGAWTDQLLRRFADQARSRWHLSMQ